MIQDCYRQLKINTLKKNSALLILSAFLLTVNPLFADSPLTSTGFSKAYANEKIVIIASETKGILTEDLTVWLASEKNPIAVKMAVINKLGWETEGRNNSLFFLNHLKKERGYKDEKDFAINGKDFELLCMAYLKAMENYFEVNSAIEYAERAQAKNSGSYTFKIITALIKAQKELNRDWCEVYRMTNRVREEKILLSDMNMEAIKIIFNYMDLYKESCKN